MIVLWDTSEDHDTANSEIGLDCGQLLTPLSRRAYRGGRFAIDNGAYAGLNVPGFLSLVERMKPHREHCIFVACPDVVGRAMRTLEMFRFWSERLWSWPLAYVAQDGQEHVEIPWLQCKAIFIGGNDQFKLGGEAKAIINVAKAMGKWVHIGRCNSPERVSKFESLGADSIDGTGISQYTWMRRDVAGRNEILFPEDVR